MGFPIIPTGKSGKQRVEEAGHICQKGHGLIDQTPRCAPETCREAGVSHHRGTSMDNYEGRRRTQDWSWQWQNHIQNHAKSKSMKVDFFSIQFWPTKKSWKHDEKFINPPSLHLSADIGPTQLLELELEQHQHRPIPKPWPVHLKHSHLHMVCTWSHGHWNMKLYICQRSCHINAKMHVDTWM